MDIDIIFRIAGIGILISVLSIVLKQAKKEGHTEEEAQIIAYNKKYAVS